MKIISTKKIIFLSSLLFLCSTIFGQLFSKGRWKPYTTEQKQGFFTDALKKGEFNDEIFETTSTPDKWENESVIILAKKIWHTGYVNNWNQVAYYTYKARIRFKLQDLTAVKDFSTYYFDKDELIEITIEKPDGTRTTIDEDDAIKVSEEITLPYFGKIDINETKKIAFENLEPGDILDVIVMEKSKHLKSVWHWTDPITAIPSFFSVPFFKSMMALGNTYSPPYSTNNTILLNADYPVVEQRIDFDLGKHFYLNFRSINGAPELEEATRKRRRRKRWVFHDTMRDKIKDEVWSNPLASLPAVKYEVNFMNKRTRRKTEKIINKKERLNTETTHKDLQKITHRFIKNSRRITGNTYSDFYKKEGKKIKGDKEFISAFYNYYKTTTLYRIARRSNRPAYDASINNAAFVGYVVKILRKRKIPYKLIMGVPRSSGGMQGLIGVGDLMWGVKVIYDDDEVIYTDCDLYAGPGDVNPNFEGTPLYEITPSWRKKKIKIEEIEIPVSVPTKNQFSYKIAAEFQEDLDTLKVKRETHLTGMARYKYKDKTFPYHKYYETLKEKFGYDYTFVSALLYDKNLLKDEDFLEAEDERITESVLNRKAYFVKRNIKRNIKSDYLLADYTKLEVIQDGLDLEEPDIIYTEEYRLLDLLDEAGNGTYILKVGEFIDGQIEVKDKEERERQTAISFPYSRSYVYDIEITIPAQMQVVGIESLNRDVNTEIGSFKTTAKLSNNVLTVKVEKNYKGIYHDKEKWEQVLKFIDEAVDFRSAKVILKKQ